MYNYHGVLSYIENLNVFCISFPVFWTNKVNNELIAGNSKSELLPVYILWLLSHVLADETFLVNFSRYSSEDSIRDNIMIEHDFMIKLYCLILYYSVIILF